MIHCYSTSKMNNAFIDSSFLSNKVITSTKQFEEECKSACKFIKSVIRSTLDHDHILILLNHRMAHLDEIIKRYSQELLVSNKPESQDKQQEFLLIKDEYKNIKTEYNTRRQNIIDKLAKEGLSILATEIITNKQEYKQFLSTSIQEIIALLESATENTELIRNDLFNSLMSYLCSLINTI